MTHSRETFGTALAVGFVALVAVIPSAAFGEIIDRIVARVDNEIITRHDLEQATTPYLLQRGMQPDVLEDEERRQEIHEKVLENLIERKLIVKKAKEMDLSVRDKQIEQWLARQRSSQGMSEEQMRSMIERYGMSYDQYRDTVRQNLLKIRFTNMKLGRQVSVSDEEVDEQYRERFGPAGETEKQVTVRQILIQPDGDDRQALNEARKEARELRTQLDGGAKFTELAKKHGDGPAAEEGGLLGSFSRGELNPSFDVVFELGRGEYSEVVETKHGFHILRVDDVSEKASGNVEKRKKMIRRKLRQQKMQNELETYVEQLREKAFIDIKI
jgi:parvulin-like peptidyl-prolyl isomerase